MISAKSNLISVLLLLSTVACQPTPSDETRDTGPVVVNRLFVRKLSQESVLGTYFVARIKVYNQGRRMTDAEESAIHDLARKMTFGLLHFDSDGRCQSIFYNQRTEAPFTIKGTDLKLKDSTYHHLTVAQNGFTMTLRRRVNGNPVDLEHRVYRLDLKEDTDQFLRLGKTIFTRPTQPQTDEQIRQRVKQTLAFYSLYFRAIHDSNIVTFKPGVVCLPVKFYYGAIKPIAFSSSDDWAQLYATPDDAFKAYALLDSTIVKVRNFPHRSTYALGYSAVLNAVNQRL